MCVSGQFGPRHISYTTGRLVSALTLEDYCLGCVAVTSVLAGLMGAELGLSTSSFRPLFWLFLLRIYPRLLIIVTGAKTGHGVRGLVLHCDQLWLYNPFVVFRL